MSLTKQILIGAAAFVTAGSTVCGIAYADFVAREKACHELQSKQVTLLVNAKVAVENDDINNMIDLNKEIGEVKAVAEEKSCRMI